MSQGTMEHLAEFKARMVKEGKILGEPPKSGMGYWRGEGSRDLDTGNPQATVDHRNFSSFSNIQQPGAANSTQFSELRIPSTGRIYDHIPLKAIRFQGPRQNLDSFRRMNAEKYSFEAPNATLTPPFLSSSNGDRKVHSVQGSEGPIRSFERVSPMTSFKAGHTEHSASPDENTTENLPENFELDSPYVDEDLESLKCVSEPDSDTESWVNEPTIAELEEKLRYKDNWVKELCDKLEETTAQRYYAKMLHEKQLKEKDDIGNKLLGRLRGAEIELCNLRHKYTQEQPAKKALMEENKAQMDSLIRQHKMDFAIVQGNCHENLRVAENMRLEELAQVEERILKCNADWTAERKDLVAKLEAKKEQEEAWAMESALLKAKLEAMNARDEKLVNLAKVANEGYDELNHETAKAKAQLERLPSKNELGQKGPLDHDRATLPLVEIKKVIQEFRVRLYEAVAADTTAREKTAKLESQVECLEKELHYLKSSHEEELKEQEAKYLDRAANQSQAFANQQRQCMSELLMLQDIKVPALVGQVNGLRQVIQNLQDTCRRKSELCMALNRALISKSESLASEQETIQADNIRLRNDNKSLLQDRAARQSSLEKLEQTYNRLGKAHEIAQAAHKYLEARLCKANLMCYNQSLLG